MWGLMQYYLVIVLLLKNTEFVDGKIIANYEKRAQGEPIMANPSIGASKSFKINDGALKEVKNK